MFFGGLGLTTSLRINSNVSKPRQQESHDPKLDPSIIEEEEEKRRGGEEEMEKDCPWEKHSLFFLKIMQST
jgi:hypothetical protein